MARKKDVWDSLVEQKLRVAFPYPYPETNWKGEPIEEEEREDYYDAGDDPMISFLTGKATKAELRYAATKDIEFVEFDGSFYETVDYDSIPQGTEDECESIVKIEGQHFSVGVYFTSYSGYRLSDVAHAVNPKTVEVVVYE